MFCPDCGKETPDGRRYCVHCGTDVGAALTPPPVTPSPADSVGDAATKFWAGSLPEIARGTVIADRYEVLSLLGKGGMGAVYRVRDEMLDEELALKVLHPQLMASETALRRFTEEARTSLRLQHPNIVRVRDLGQWGGQRYLTMELLEGRTLGDWLRQSQQEDRQAPVEVVVSIMEQVLGALEYAHRTTVHRDIKPENIFLENAEPEFRVKLLDFGIAKVLDRESLTSTSTSLGTAWYMAPEQFQDPSSVDQRADLYAVGAVFYEALTGKAPHGVFDPPSVARPALGGSWDELLQSALQNDRSRRPADATRFRVAVTGALHGELLARRPSLQVSPHREDVLDRAAQHDPNPSWSSASRAGELRTLTLDGVEFGFVWIPPGHDVLGSPENEPGRRDDEGQWTAEFSRGFWMQATQVTQALWTALMGTNPSHHEGCEDCPVESVSWDDAQEFLEKLNERVPDGGFRLPTEAEWEYTARAGEDGPFGLPCRDDSAKTPDGRVPRLDEFAWYGMNSDGRTHRVGRLAANAWGLHDMHGDVWEWTSSWYGRYPAGRALDWEGPASGSGRVLRGGSWGNDAGGARAANRSWVTPGYRTSDYGFRCARDVR